MIHALFLSALAAVPATAPARAPGPAPSPAPRLEVVTTLSFLADLARRVGGDRVHVVALADPREDPHYVQPRPTLMQRAREADVFVELGLQLDLWAGKVVEGSGNPRIQTGQPGRVIASAGIATLELPEVLSREWGDVHPFGNPHVWLDPLNAKDVAANIAHALERVDTDPEAGYSKRLAAFEGEIDAALFGPALVEEVGGKMLTRQARKGTLGTWLAEKKLSEKLGGWLARAAPLRGRPVVTYHKSWVYFARRFGLEVAVEIEEKPGISPSARHRDLVVDTIRKKGVKTILQEVFYERGAADYLARETGAKVVVVPIDVGESVGTKSYFEMVDLVLARLLDSEGAPAAPAAR